MIKSLLSLLLLASTAHAAVSLLDAPFLVTGDGVTDDTAAIQAVIEYAESTGQKIEIPPAPGGYYKITDELVLDRPGLIMEGEGFAVESRSKIRQTSAGKHCFRIHFPDHYPSNHYLSFRNFSIEGPGAEVSTGDGFNIVLPEGNFTDEIYLENMRIAYFRNGFRADHWSNSTLSNVTFDGNYNAFVAGGNCNAINLNGCWLGNNLNACLVITGSGGITLRGCELGNSPRLATLAEASWLVMENCSAESIAGGTDPAGVPIVAAIELRTNANLIIDTFKIHGGGASTLPLIRAHYNTVKLHEIRMAGYVMPCVSLDRTGNTTASVTSNIGDSPNTPLVRVWWNGSYSSLAASYKVSTLATIPGYLPSASDALRGVEIDVFADTGDYRVKCVRKSSGAYAWAFLTN